jgi:hypothetical protein
MALKGEFEPEPRPRRIEGMARLDKNSYSELPTVLENHKQDTPAPQQLRASPAPAVAIAGVQIQQGLSLQLVQVVWLAIAGIASVWEWYRTC